MLIRNPLKKDQITPDNPKVLAQKIIEVLGDEAGCAKIQTRAREKISAKFNLSKQVKQIEGCWLN